MTRAERALGPLAVAACATAVLALAVSFWNERRYDPDSWACYELARSLLRGEPGRLEIARHFNQDTPWSTSFPPVYPLLIAGVEAALGLGVRSAYLLNVVIALALLGALARLSQRLVGDLLPGALVFAFVLANRNFTSEVIAAKTIPLAALWLVALLNVLLARDPTRPATVALSALLAGAWVMTRFDFLLAAGALGLVLVACQPDLRARARAAAVYGAVLLATLSPWIVYCLARFGRPWVSDNSRTVLLADTPHVLVYLPHPELLPSLRTAPGEWVVAKLAVAMPVVANMVVAATYSALPALLVLALGAAVAARLGHPAGADLLGAAARAPLVRRWALLAPSFVLLHASIALTGYDDLRYVAPLLLWAQAGAVLALCAAWAGRGLPPALLRGALAVALVVLLARFVGGRPPRWTGTIAVVVALGAAHAGRRFDLVRPACAGLVVVALAVLGRGVVKATPPLPERPAWPPALLEALRSDPSTRLLMDSEQAPGFHVATGLRVSQRPWHLRPLAAVLFIDEYRFTHVQAGDALLDSVVAQVYATERIALPDGGALHALKGKREGVRLLRLRPGPERPLGLAPDRRAVAVEDAAGVVPGTRLWFHVSGERTVTAVDGGVLSLDVALDEPLPLGDPRPSLDGAPLPVLALPPLR